MNLLHSSYLVSSNNAPHTAVADDPNIGCVGDYINGQITFIKIYLQDSCRNKTLLLVSAAITYNVRCKLDRNLKLGFNYGLQQINTVNRLFTHLL